MNACAFDNWLTILDISDKSALIIILCYTL